MLELANKDFNRAIISDLNKNALGKMQEKIRHLTEETETIEKNQMEILELKNTISEIKNSLNGFNSRMEMKGSMNQNTDEQK